MRNNKCCKHKIHEAKTVSKLLQQLAYIEKFSSFKIEQLQAIIFSRFKYFTKFCQSLANDFFSIICNKVEKYLFLHKSYYILENNLRTLTIIENKCNEGVRSYKILTTVAKYCIWNHQNCWQAVFILQLTT